MKQVCFSEAIAARLLAADFFRIPVCNPVRPFDLMRSGAASGSQCRRSGRLPFRRLGILEGCSSAGWSHGRIAHRRVGPRMSACESARSRNKLFGSSRSHPELSDRRPKFVAPLTIRRFGRARKSRAFSTRPGKSCQTSRRERAERKGRRTPDGTVHIGSKDDLPTTCQ